jgi:hypothetical protein
MPSLTQSQALARYAAVVGPAKRAQSLAMVGRYLAWGGTHEDAVFARYLREMEAAGYKVTTVALHARIIRAFYRALGARPPYAPLVVDEEADSDSPALAVDLVRRLIAAARTEAVDPWPRGLLAVATLYGSRAVELSWVRPTSWRDDTIVLHSAKGSRTRTLWWPASPVLDRVRAGPWPVCTAHAVERQMDEIWAAAGLERPRGVSWHAIRHGLHAALKAAGVSSADRRAFGGWAGKTPMEERYAQPSRMVGVAGDVAPPAQDARAEHAAVWAAHPWLADWQ